MSNNPANPFVQTAAEREFLQAKMARKAELRAEYNKQISNPFRCATGEGGSVFDPALQRYQAMRVSHFEHFKPTGLSLRTGLLCVVGPVVLYTWWMKWDRDRREQEFRTGKVSYADRKFKFI